VPLLVIPPRNVAAELPVLSHVLPALIVTKPVKSFVPVVEDITRSPLVPPPTVVVPVTVNAKPAAVNVVPSPITRLCEIVVAMPVDVLVVPLVLRS